MTTLLVMTAGQSDVQLVDGSTRRELRKERCASLHDEIERRAGGWRLVDSPEGKAAAIEVLPEGELRLCTPKLDAVLRYLADQCITPTTALVLETRRDASAERGDPRFAGALLETRLSDKGVCVNRQAYLTGAERLEDRVVPRDAIIRREVVQRLDFAVRKGVGDARLERVVVATTGGMPIVSDLVEEVVRLHAPPGTAVHSLEIADGARANPPGADRAVARSSMPEPLASYQARRRALEFVEKGNLLGAWAVSQPLHDDEVEHEWTQVMEWLACFASSLPIPAPCDIPVLTHQRMAVRVALRVELALRAGDIPRAAHGTVAFFEAALWDHLGERVERHPDAKKRRQFKLDPLPAADLVRKGEPYKSKKTAEDDRKRPFVHKETVDGTDWYWIDDSEVCAIRLAKHYRSALASRSSVRRCRGAMCASCETMWPTTSPRPRSWRTRVAGWSKHCCGPRAVPSSSSRWSKRSCASSESSLLRVSSSTCWRLSAPDYLSREHDQEPRPPRRFATARL
jgi:hypothetical protein